MRSCYLEEEKKWILKNVPNGEKIINMKNPNDVIGALCDYFAAAMTRDDEPTQKTYEAEAIMDRIANDDDDWPKWDGDN